MTIICRIMASNPTDAKTPGRGLVTILDLTTNGEETRRIVVSRTQDIPMNLGDSIKCVSGMAVVLINPGTGAGAYFLCTHPPTPNNGKYLTELEINEETTRIISRGKIVMTNDVGSIMRATGATIR
jgi:hypothetical protein